MYNISELIKKCVDEVLSKDFYNIVLNESIQGEWWITPWGVKFADGDLGEMNHEGHVLEALHRELLADMGIDCDDEHCSMLNYVDAIYDEIHEDMNGFEKVMWKDKQYLEAIESYLTRTITNDPLLKEKFKCIFGWMDARAYGMKYLKWKRVKGNIIQTETLTSDDIKVIVNGINEMSDSDEDDDKYNIEVNATRSYYQDIPYAVLQKKSPMALQPYRGRY